MTWSESLKRHYLKTLALCLFAAVLPQGAAAFVSPAYDDPEAAVNEILDPLLANDRDLFGEKMTLLFDDTGNQIEKVVFDSFLVKDEVFNYVDRLNSEPLGETMLRHIFVLRTSADDFLFLRISLAKSSRGWVAYDLDVQSELSTFLPDWDDP